MRIIRVCPNRKQHFTPVYRLEPAEQLPVPISIRVCARFFGSCWYAGKGQGEVSLLRRMWDTFRPGDVLLADSLMSNWTGIVMLKERGCELVSRLNKGRRKADFRKGIRLGKDDHIVCWRKPNSIRSVDRKTYNSFPDEVAIREVRVRVEQPGFRTKTVVVVTTLLDPKQTTKEDLAKLYRARWNNEVCQAGYTERSLLYLVAA